MTDTEILQKAMEKAIANGMDRGDFSTPAAIYSHSFAKAFWPGIWIKDALTGNEFMAWQYHLQQMVLEEDPIKYLEKFI